MNIGLTGTRFGMTDNQKRQVELLFSGWEPGQLHIGVCKGSDEEAVGIARRVLGKRCWVVGHPGPKLDPWHSPVLCDEYREPTTHFARNRNIVNVVDFMLATPREAEEQPYGGTWYTVRYARKIGRPIEVIAP